MNYESGRLFNAIENNIYLKGNDISEHVCIVYVPSCMYVSLRPPIGSTNLVSATQPSSYKVNIIDGKNMTVAVVVMMMMAMIVCTYIHRGTYACCFCLFVESITIDTWES